MFKLVVLAVAVVASANANAFPMFCNGTNGYQVSVNPKGQVAQVYQNEEQVMFGKLKCTTIFTMEVKPEGSPIIACRTAQNVADAGFYLYVYRPHGTDKLIGRLDEQSIAGPHRASDMKCVMAVN